ncbi:hypothetical protein Q8A67_000493 [Cirrhinus molitorella]|uniref:Uncharacterized protein n=1 Tax=Cirrhinus molitorella TaxID=172907 RepID=A0AA88TYT2_9TELE|nr:hypothetical protein Q8A67_000493 [Cirrhinus molitorella]
MRRFQASWAGEEVLRYRSMNIWSSQNYNQEVFLTKRILWRPLLRLRMESLKRSPEAVKSASSCNASTSDAH